jgi:DNA repair exonuclease SbcCD ATPase subunit
MAGDESVSVLRGDLQALRSQITEHHQSQQALLRELAGILHTVSSAFAASNQITASEREHLLSRLENIYLALSQDRRDINESLRRLEQNINDVDNSVQSLHDERKRSVELFTEHHEQFLAEIAPLKPQVEEMRKHLRGLLQKNEITGDDLPISDRIWKVLIKALVSAFATATIILFLTKVLVPWLVGLKGVDVTPAGPAAPAPVKPSAPINP